jgi:hypothetical protein
LSRGSAPRIVEDAARCTSGVLEVNNNLAIESGESSVRNQNDE